MAKRKPKSEARKLVNELKDLFLRDGAGLEMVEKGLYHKAKANLDKFGGSVDKNSEHLTKVKEVVEALDEVV